MKLNICMLLFFRYQPNMRVVPQVGICGYLRHFGHNVTWIMWGGESRHVESFFLNGIRVYIIPEVKYLPSTWPLAEIINLIPNTLRRMCTILRILRKGKYDLIFVRDFAFDGVVAAYIGRRHKIPFVFHLSNPLDQVWEEYKIYSPKAIFLYYLVAKLHQFVATRLLHKADLILPTSRYLKEQLIEQGISESKIMPYPNGVDINSFSNRDGTNVRNRYHLDNLKTIIYVGILVKPRHLTLLIQAFAEVKKQRKNVKLLMVGGGDDEGNLRQLAAELGVGDDIIFTGQVPQSEVSDFIAAADVGVSPVPPLPFFKVSSPIKLLEYMAMVKPVVANEEIPEQKEVLEESGGGILVPFTPEAFAAAIIELLDNPELATEMGRRGREWLVQNRSYDVLARRLEQRYLELLGDYG